MMNIIPADDNHRIAYMYDEDAQGVRNDKPYKGIVVAMMTNCDIDAIVKLNSYDLNMVNIFDATNINDCINSTYRGVAYCAADDKFDLKEGMRIARERMLEKYYKSQRRVFKDIKGELDKASKIIDDLITKTYKH